MRTLTVHVKDNADVKTIIDVLRLMKGVEKVTLDEAPMLRMTLQEFNEEIDSSLEDASQGRTISHEEMGNKIAGWR